MDKNQPQQPAAAPAEQPTQTPQPQTITAPQGQQVQYVVAKKSLEGIGGWLAVWLVIAGLAGIGYIMAGLGGADSSASFNGVEIPKFLSLILGAGYFATAVLISMRKKYGIWSSIGIVAFSSLISIVTSLSAGVDDTSPAATIVMNLLFAGLISLYFLKSERVKLTLVK